MQKNIILFLLEIMRKKTEIITVQDTMPLLSLLTIATCKEAALAARPQKTMPHGHNSPEAAKSHYKYQKGQFLRSPGYFEISGFRWSFDCQTLKAM